MDPVTHGVIGATLTQSAAPEKKLRPAALAGLVAAVLADLDIFIANPADPLLNVEFHRQFTHSLVFIPAGAMLAALLTWWVLKRYLSLKETYLFSLLGYATSGLADAFTSYGTQLLWPFAESRVSWNIISVFDPLFTTGIVLLSGYAFYRHRRHFAWLAIVWMGIYLLFGISQREKTRQAAMQLAAQKHHSVDQLVVKPTIANQLVWSIRYRSGDSLHSAGLRLSPFSESIMYKGASTELLKWQEEYADYKGTVLYNDLRRFDKLSEGMLVRHPNYHQVIGDGRYAMLPTSVVPLWGVTVDTTQPGRHLPFKTYRETNPEIRETFLQMLMGRQEI